MKRLLSVPLVILALGACDHPVSRAEFDELKANHELVVAQLNSWSAGMYQWGVQTATALCDVKRKNTPDVNPYADATNDYCGLGDPPPGTPPIPPDWGEE